MKETIDRIFHDNYLRKIKIEKRIVTFWQIVLFLLFLSLWEIASRLHLIDPLLFSSPTKVSSLLYEKVLDGSMLNALQVTLFETVLGFIIGTVLGIILASILWSSVRLAKIADPYLVIFNAMPKVALGPIIIVAFGPGYLSIIMMGAIISVIITTLVVYSAFNEVDPNYEKVLKSFGATRRQCFKEAIFPATLPTMISTLKVNVGLSWVGVIVGEFLVSNKGLGYLIIYGFQVFDFTLVMSSLVVIALLAAIMYKIVEKLESWLIKHTA
ncbi:ABC transporter permease [Pseudogracilibacillus auburnensis]|uniref:NitT/TauT family transport system permease protein n=1 Tax=Pseudogracilibacillus auburnensis TaxID=1494959 RepID=A0A2V3VHS8_9BACI|nr:ABC transporter permease [Pseudogracilibacillus auburnensis]MBO1005889.1 ABC transporter permease [Pseudogracilibacillus auburnensis]PXW81396.1 NitT/TauT family transport system permease protein [Pseudogracilibacillus auburnensis]